MMAEAMLADRWRNAVVIFANYAQFMKGQVAFHPLVKSRMLAFCKAGRGAITVNGQREELARGDFLFTPWDHQIRYEADDRDPFLVACCHIIPDHDPNVPVRYAVAHHADDEAATYSWRRDADDPALRGLAKRTPAISPAFESLVDYVVKTFICCVPPARLAGQLAQLLLAELTLFRESRGKSILDVPPPLSKIMMYLQDRLHAHSKREELKQEVLTRVFGLSASTVRRLFKEHLGTTPTEWIVEQRITSAKAILRNSREPVAVVGEKVGLPDPYHFSKVFKQRTGVSPREWRRSSPKR